MTHFEARADLDVVVAERYALPAVRRAAVELRARAAINAPDAEVWLTAHDERVRPSHAEADGQIIPANLRFLLRKVATGNDVNDVRAGWDQARAPRDPNLPIGNRVNCRCVAVPLRGVIGRAVTAGPAMMSGARVSARVSVQFPRVAESEHPSDPDTGGGWLQRAVSETLAGMRARRR